MLLLSHAPWGGSIGFLPPSNAAGGAGRRQSKAPEAQDHTPALGAGVPSGPGDPQAPTPCTRSPGAQHPGMFSAGRMGGADNS